MKKAKRLFCALLALLLFTGLCLPAGAAIVIYGHSLGGMIAQRIICDSDLTAAYEFLNALTFGSPYIVTDKAKREGTLVSLQDTDDIVPKFSLAIVLSREDYNGGLRRTGGFERDLNGAHNVSYKMNDTWGDLDALGVPDGGAVLTLDLDGLVTLPS